MEYTFFELQVCIEILIFKEKSNFGYADHPEITTSLAKTMGGGLPAVDELTGGATGTPLGPEANLVGASSASRCA